MALTGTAHAGQSNLIQRLPLQSSVFLLIFLFPVFAYADPQPTEDQRVHFWGSVDGDFRTAWRSRYVTEGRDNLDGDSIWVSSLNTGWNRLWAKVWYGISPDQKYDELNLFVGAIEKIGSLEFSAAYNHIRYPHNGEEGNEISLTAIWSDWFYGAELIIDGDYTFDDHGWFLTALLQKDWEVTPKLIMSGAGIFGLNQGYIPDGHNGANHVAIRADTEYFLISNWYLTAYATYSWALDRDIELRGDRQLIDMFYGGVGLRLYF